jgi:hypothetical protein
VRDGFVVPQAQCRNEWGCGLLKAAKSLQDQDPI